MESEGLEVDLSHRQIIESWFSDDIAKLKTQNQEYDEEDDVMEKTKSHKENKRGQNQQAVAMSLVDQTLGKSIQRQKNRSKESYREFFFGKAPEGFRLLAAAKHMRRQIGEFVKSHKVTTPLPRGRNMNWLLQRTDSSSYLTEDERDRVTNYLCVTFRELRNISNPEVSSLIHDTIEFIIARSHQKKDQLKNDDNESKASLVAKKSSMSCQQSTSNCNGGTKGAGTISKSALRRKKKKLNKLKEKQVLVSETSSQSTLGEEIEAMNSLHQKWPENASSHTEENRLLSVKQMEIPRAVSPKKQFWKVTVMETIKNKNIETDFVELYHKSPLNQCKKLKNKCSVNDLRNLKCDETKKWVSNTIPIGDRSDKSTIKTSKNIQIKRRHSLDNMFPKTRVHKRYHSESCETKTIPHHVSFENNKKTKKVSLNEQAYFSGNILTENVQTSSHDILDKHKHRKKLKSHHKIKHEENLSPLRRVFTETMYSRDISTKGSPDNQQQITTPKQKKDESTLSNHSRDNKHTPVVANHGTGRKHIYNLSNQMADQQQIFRLSNHVAEKRSCDLYSPKKKERNRDNNGLENSLEPMVNSKDVNCSSYEKKNFQRGYETVERNSVDTKNVFSKHDKSSRKKKKIRKMDINGNEECNNFTQLKIVDSCRKNTCNASATSEVKMTNLHSNNKKSPKRPSNNCIHTQKVKKAKLSHSRNGNDSISTDNFVVTENVKNRKGLHSKAPEREHSKKKIYPNPTNSHVNLSTHTSTVQLPEQQSLKKERCEKKKHKSKSKEKKTFNRDVDMDKEKHSCRHASLISTDSHSDCPMCRNCKKEVLCYLCSVEHKEMEFA